MATELPNALRAADISRFALRATQLEKFKPVVAYWCNYYVVNQILNRGLHTSDDESMTYTTNLMDRLERIKTQHADDNAIADDVASHAYVEQFALDTFQRAEKAVQANSVTAQTADTYRAAATFLDLVVGTWSSPSPELAAKSKYAKFHALRIAKALKAGEDPNLSNPPPASSSPQPTSPDPMASPSAAPESLPRLDPADPEVRRITDEELPDASPAASAPPPLSPAQHHPLAPGAPRPDVSPITPSSPTTPPPPPPRTSNHTTITAAAATPSAPDGYFPQVPTFTAEASAPVIASGPNIDAPRSSTVTAPAPPLPPMADPHAFYASPTSPPPPVPAPAPAPARAPLAQHYQQQAAGVPQTYMADDEAMMAAQKHARWAVSALNFEDVDTAVRELRTALQALGAG